MGQHFRVCHFAAVYIIWVSTFVVGLEGGEVAEEQDGCEHPAGQIVGVFFFESDEAGFDLLERHFGVPLVLVVLILQVVEILDGVGPALAGTQKVSLLFLGGQPFQQFVENMEVLLVVSSTDDPRLFQQVVVDLDLLDFQGVVQRNVEVLPETRTVVVADRL